jgi:hypothetical protein
MQTYGKPVQTRHHNIEQENIVGSGLGVFNYRLPIANDFDGMPSVFQSEPSHKLDVWFVLSQ